jgi:hypothetical protein
MRRIIHTALGGLAAVLVMTGTATAQRATTVPVPGLTDTDGAPAEFESAPGSQADAIARKLMAGQIQQAKERGEKPIVRVAMGWLHDKDEMLVVQLVSPEDCGHDDCSFTAFKNVEGQWVRDTDIAGVERISSR